MNQRQNKNLIRIITAAALMVVLAYVPLSGTARFLAYLVPYFVVGYDILIKAAKGVWRRQPLDECLLMAVATVGAMALAVYEDGDYTEGIAVMLLRRMCGRIPGGRFRHALLSGRRVVPVVCSRPQPPQYLGAHGHTPRLR